MVPRSFPMMSEDTSVTQPPMEMDEIYQCYNTRTYRSPYQDRQIAELESRLKDKQNERTKSIQSIIAYFYNK